MGKFVDLTGMKFNRLTVRSYYGRSAHNCALWLCDCECGGTTVVRTAQLKNGKTKSCGCLHKEASLKNLPAPMVGEENPRYSHGGCKTRLYHVWCDIKGRCYNKNRENFERYGAKGITMCDAWKNDFKSFEKWAYENGYTENSTGKELSIDRIDPNKGYYPDNCQWISLSENVTRRNIDYWNCAHANQR